MEKKQPTPEEKAKELIEFFRPLMYCYIGSEMLTNTFNERIQIKNAKECAKRVCDENLLSQSNNWTSSRSIELIKFWNAVYAEIDFNTPH